MVGRCLYGIDINPMAVELCKVSLWLVANTPGRPLGFLDHHIVCGNSLLGTTPALLASGLPNEAFKALTGDDKKRVNQLRKTNRAERKQRDQGLIPLEWSPRDDVAALAEDVQVLMPRAGETARDEAAKAEMYDEYQHSDTYERSKLAADAWCAAFVNPKQQGEPVITDSTVRAIGEGHDVVPEVVRRVRQLADQYQFLHLHLVFPDVEERGGFDAVLGNPPWEKVKLLQKEWFSSREPEIAAAQNKAARLKLIEQMRHDDPEMYEAFQWAARMCRAPKPASLSSCSVPRRRPTPTGHFPCLGKTSPCSIPTPAPARSSGLGKTWKPPGRCTNEPRSCGGKHGVTSWNRIRGVCRSNECSTWPTTPTSFGLGPSWNPMAGSSAATVSSKMQKSTYHFMRRSCSTSTTTASPRSRGHQPKNSEPARPGR